MSLLTIKQTVEILNQHPQKYYVENITLAIEDYNKKESETEFLIRKQKKNSDDENKVVKHFYPLSWRREIIK